MPQTSSRPDVPTSTLPAPQPTHPVAGRSVTDEAPEFRWTGLPDAETYRLQLAGSETFDPCYYDETVDGPTTVALGEVLPDEVETVVWRVRVETEEEGPWSGPASFTRSDPDDAPASGQFLVDAPPVPIRPIQGDAVDAEAATFTWEGVPEASGYRVQVAPSSAFEEPRVDLTLDQTTQLTLFEELPGEQSPLYWRLRALFPNDTEGPWSEVGRFGTDPDVEGDVPAEAPADAAPDEGALDRSPVAAGPAREARTSGTAAIVAIGVLVVSFLITILLVMLGL